MASHSQSSARQPRSDVSARQIGRESGPAPLTGHSAIVGPAPKDTSRDTDAQDERCPTCQSPKCLALVRAGEPPADWKDLVHRLAMLFCSGHWTWHKTANLVVTSSCLALLFYACAGNRIPLVIEYLGASPFRWGSVSGCCVLASAVGLWRVRRRRVATDDRERHSRFH